MKTRHIISASLLAFLMAGCASTDPKAPFRDVEKTTALRTGAAIHWRRIDPGNREIANTTKELLATNLTASGAVQIALLNSPALQAEFEEIGISQADVAQASRLPNIELAGSWRFPNRPPSAADIEYSAAGNLLDLLTLPARKKLAARNLETVKLKIADEILRLSAEVQTAFYNLQARMELVSRLETILEINDATADLAQRQFDAGNISELELENQQAPVAQTRLELVGAKARVRIDRERLNRLLGVPGPPPDWKLAPELPPLPAVEPGLENLESLGASQRLDLASARNRAEALASALRLKRNTRFTPGVGVGVDTERMPDGQRVTGPTLDLELPLFDQGQPAVARLTSELAQARDLYEAQELNVHSEIRQARETMLAAREAAELTEKSVLPLRKKILGETLLHYNAMQKNAYDLLLAKEREQIAEQNLVESKLDYWLARVELERAVGGRLFNDAPTEPKAERKKP